MNKFFLPPIFILTEYAFLQIFGLRWPFFDSAFVLVAIFTFFHSHDLKEFLFFSLFCGFCRDIFSIDFFGLHMLSYAVCAVCIAAVSNIIYRHNRTFIFLFVFIGVFLNSQVAQLLRALLFGVQYQPFSGALILRVFIMAAGSTFLVYPITYFTKRCVPEFTA